MRKSHFSVECLHACICKSCKGDIFPQVNCLPDKVTGNCGHGNAFTGCKVMYNSIQWRLNNNVYSRILGWHGSLSFWVSVTLVMHRVKTKITLQAIHDYRLKWWIPIKIAECLTRKKCSLITPTTPEVMYSGRTEDCRLK